MEWEYDIARGAFLMLTISTGRSIHLAVRVACISRGQLHINRIKFSRLSRPAKRGPDLSELVRSDDFWSNFL